MICYDFETYKHDWLVCYLDTDTRTMHKIINDKTAFEQMYAKYKNTIWIGFNSRNFDQWIAKGILAGFDPYKITDWIINKDRKGYEYSRLLHKFPILNYDCSVGFRSLKEIEAFMGNDIRETTVPFDIDRKLTLAEIDEVVKYCEHDVWNTFEVFVETKDMFETQIGLIKEFKLTPDSISKTQTQLASIILGAEKRQYDDEHEFKFSPNIELKKYKEIREWFEEQSRNKTDFKGNKIVVIDGVEITYAWGGVHGARENHIGDGFYVLSDINSMYPSMMIEFDLLSRSVKDKEKFKRIYKTRFDLKAKKDKKENLYKLTMNKTYGALLDQYNLMFDPRNGRSVCVNGQLALTMLIEMVEQHCELININTDGIMVKLTSESDFQKYKSICDEWERKTKLRLGHDVITKVIQRDVNNAIFVHKNGKVKCIGAHVKYTSRIDNHLPIVNKALREYFINGTPVEKTILPSDNLIDFQFITKVSGKYDNAMHNDQILTNKVYRVFASKNPSDGTLYKKHKSKVTYDKTAGTPNNCRIWNESVNGVTCPDWLDKQWYIDLAKERIRKFLGE